uniref:NADH dehydrogenase [ubiquinone] 1 beta subcomplex subunit 11, mitochondrial n=1 Tax=Photinus pyralis TaxID=7054 RepID=A0A1Y1JRF0_PHOPY
MKKKSSEVLAKISSNWISYGFDSKDEKWDRTVMHLSMFGGITLGLVLVAYGFMYAPDVNLKHWAQREAFLELRRREAKGLKPIDPNLVDPSLVILPSDEELGNTEVII